MCGLTEAVVFKTVHSLKYAPNAGVFTKVSSELAARVVILFASLFSAADSFVQLLAFGGKGMYWLASKISCGYLASSSGSVALRHLSAAFVCAAGAFTLPLKGVISPFGAMAKERRFYTDLFFLTPPQPRLQPRNVGAHRLPGQNRAVPVSQPLIVNAQHPPLFALVWQDNPPADAEVVARFFRDNPQVNLSEVDRVGKTAPYRAVMKSNPNVHLIQAFAEKGAFDTYTIADLERILSEAALSATVLVPLISYSKERARLTQLLREISEREGNTPKKRMALEALTTIDNGRSFFGLRDELLRWGLHAGPGDPIANIIGSYAEGDYTPPNVALAARQELEALQRQHQQGWE